MSNITWERRHEALKAIHDKIAEALAKLDKPTDPQTAQLLDDVGNLLFDNPAKYLPVRLTDGAQFYTAGGGAGGGLVQNQIRDEADTSWINEPFIRKVMGSQNQPLLQRATTYDLFVQLRNAGAEIDPRNIRALTSFDVVSVEQTNRSNLKVQFEREDVISHGGVASPNNAGVEIVPGTAGQKIKVYDAGFHAGVDGLHYFYFGTSTTPTTKRFCTINKAGLIHKTFVSPRVGDAGDSLYIFSSVAETDLPYDVGYVKE